jgi:hypothetical protein
MSSEITKTNGSQLVTETGFSQSIQTTGSTVEAIMAAREKAKIEASFVVAKRFPRDIDVVRMDLLRACERPGFADADIEQRDKTGKIIRSKQPGSAWYKLPFGDNVEGFSIRFAEECLRVMRNIEVESSIIWDDPEKRIIKVTVLDFENNISIPTQIVVEKEIERRKPKTTNRGQAIQPLRTRVTSSGEINYIYAADERDVLKKENSAKSKAIRNAILRLVPGDIQAECRKRILEIRHGDTAKDPDGARRKMIDAFATLNVGPQDLEEYVDFDLEKLTPAQIDHLRDLFKAIKAGETTWQAIITEVRNERGTASPEEPKVKGLDAITEKLRKSVIEINEARKIFGEERPEKTSESKTETSRSAVIEAARKLWGEDQAMPMLAQLCRQKGFALTSATEEQASEVLVELEDRIEITESESEEK